MLEIGIVCDTKIARYGDIAEFRVALESAKPEYMCMISHDCVISDLEASFVDSDGTFHEFRDDNIRNVLDKILQR